jgi:hypothetical protein
VKITASDSNVYLNCSAPLIKVTFRKQFVGRWNVKELWILGYVKRTAPYVVRFGQKKGFVTSPYGDEMASPPPAAAAAAAVVVVVVVVVVAAAVAVPAAVVVAAAVAVEVHNPENVLYCSQNDLMEMLIITAFKFALEK